MIVLHTPSCTSSEAPDLEMASVLGVGGQELLLGIPSLAIREGLGLLGFDPIHDRPFQATNVGELAPILETDAPLSLGGAPRLDRSDREQQSRRSTRKAALNHHRIISKNFSKAIR
jgi:hypothetical protein